MVREMVWVGITGISNVCVMLGLGSGSVSGGSVVINSISLEVVTSVGVIRVSKSLYGLPLISDAVSNVLGTDLGYALGLVTSDMSSLVGMSSRWALGLTGIGGLLGLVR